MNKDASFSSLQFSGLMHTPQIQALLEGLKPVLPEAEWWLIGVNQEATPFPFSGRKAKGKNGAKKKLPPHAFTLPQEGQSSLISSGENDMLEGVCSLWFRGSFFGAVGVYPVPAAQRPMLEHALNVVNGYLSLFTVVLEDHDDLELINTLWNETISVVDLQDLLDRLAQQLCKTLKSVSALVLLVDEDGEFYPAKIDGLPKMLKKRRCLPVSKFDYLEFIERHDDAVYFLPEDDPVHQWFSAQLDDLNWKEERPGMKPLAVPFMRGSNLIGLFITFSDPNVPPSFNKLTLIHILASGGAAALDNALTAESMSQRRKALSTIHVVHRLISANISSQELLPRIGQLTRNLLKVNKCSIMMYDRVREMLVPVVTLGLEENETGQNELRVGEELPGWVAENFDPMIYTRGGGNPPWTGAGGKYPSESYLAVPLFDNDIEGVITIADKKGDFSPSDREILMTFSEQIVLAVKNVRLHEGERLITINALKSIANLIESQDPKTPGITVQASEWSEKIAHRLGLNQRDYHNLVFASLVHDTGMLRYLSSGTPTDEDRLRSPQFSLYMAQSLNLPQEVGGIVYHVNEAWNGQGYPDGLKGTQIPLGSRIIAVANTFATLLVRYRKRGGEEIGHRQRALKVIDRFGQRAFDPDVVNALAEIVENEPD